MVSKALAKSMNTPIVIRPSSVYFVSWFIKFMREIFELYLCLNLYWSLCSISFFSKKKLQCDYSLAFQITYLLRAKLRLAYNFLSILLSPFFCLRRTKFMRGLWNGLRTCVCVSVRPAQNVKVCFFSVISWPILILFVFSDRAWCGLQNFYTEFWN